MQASRFLPGFPISINRFHRYFTILLPACDLPPQTSVCSAPSLSASTRHSPYHMAKVEDHDLGEYQAVQWTHPVLPDGSLGSARGVPIRRPFIKYQLSKFTLFPQLPLDLRVYMWRMAVDFERVVCVYEDIVWPDANSEADSSEEEEDENDRSIAMINKELSRREYFNNSGQRQLEHYGFTSSRPAPALQTIPQLEHAARHRWETTRVGTFYSPDPLPVLLHVCRESRQLLQAYGYKLAFSTRTAPAGTWFNFSSDILHLRDYEDDEQASRTLDGGMWNLGQFSRDDLSQLKKLSLRMNSFDYSFGERVPIALHKAVQLCGNLQELLLIESDRHDVDRNNTYWYQGNEGGEITVVDLSVEEFWDHDPEWRPRCRYSWNYFNNSRRFEEGFERENSSYGDIAEDVAEQLRTHEPLFPDRKGWTTPKVRFVMLMARQDVEKFMRSRASYRHHIDSMYWKGVAETRRSYRPPSPLDLRDDVEAERDLWRREGSYIVPRDLTWYRQAREAIYSVYGWPSPFTMEWIEASEAMLEMDSWPWAEW